MDGSKMLPLLEISRENQPKCFKKIKSLSCTYHHDSAAWMTCDIFHEFLVCLDKIMASMKGKMLIPFSD
jgi:hypothetical protein